MGRNEGEMERFRKEGEIEKRLEERFREYEEREEREEREDSEIRSVRRVFSSREEKGYENSGTVWSEDRPSSEEVEKKENGWVRKKE